MSIGGDLDQAANQGAEAKPGAAHVTPAYKRPLCANILGDKRDRNMHLAQGSSFCAA